VSQTNFSGSLIGSHVAVYSSVSRTLQRFAVCCSVLQCVAVHDSLRVSCLRVMCVSLTGSHVAVYCRALQCVALCCSVLQCVAVCCSVLQCVAGCCRLFQGVAGCCRVLQSVAVHDSLRVSCFRLFLQSV